MVDSHVWPPLPARPRRVLAALLVYLAVAASGCGPDTPPPRKELLIYCGVTMTEPVIKIARALEREHDCIIKITKGGSGNLLRSLKQNRIGDIYFPGSASYMRTCMAEGLVTETVFVGYNQVALIVPEGNPRGLTGDPAQLAEPRLAVVMANPDSGSIGRAARRVLERRGVAEAALRNVMYFTTDSKDITKAVKNGEADLAINWYATALWPENRQEVDALLVDERYAPRSELIMGLLACSRYPDLAREFMRYAASVQGRAIFAEYGFLKPSDLEELLR